MQDLVIPICGSMKSRHLLHIQSWMVRDAIKRLICRDSLTLFRHQPRSATNIFYLNYVGMLSKWYSVNFWD